MAEVFIHGRVVAALLGSRGFSADLASAEAGIDRGRLQAALDGRGGLDGKEVAALAERLALPQAAFYLSEVPKLPVVPDFRRTVPGAVPYHVDTLKVITFIQGLAQTISDLDIRLGFDAEFRLSAFNESYISETEPSELARIWRSRFGLSSEEQFDIGDPGRFYKRVREFLEGLGVVVIHQSFNSRDAAGIFHQEADGVPIIVINTRNSSRARQCFTLAHEFCHSLVGIEGASDPSVVNNKVERYCNKFAAAFLAPDDLIQYALRKFSRAPSFEGEFLRLFSKKICLSQEATALRLVEIGVLSQGGYADWKASFAGAIPTADLGEDQFGRANPIEAKKTKYGKRLLEILSLAKRQSDLDDLDIYRISGIKPRYQRSLLTA